MDPLCDCCGGRPSRCGSGVLSYCIGDPAAEGKVGGLYAIGEDAALFGSGNCCAYWPAGGGRFVGGVETGLGGQPYAPCWG